VNAIPPLGAPPAEAAFAARPVPADPELLAAYFAQVRSFEADRLRDERRSRRLAWTVAAVASGVAFAACLAVAGLTPLKTVVPLVFRVDAATGIVDAVHDLQGGPQTQAEAVARYFVARYVRAREGYAFTEAEHQFRSVSLLSTPAEQGRYVAWFRGSNPESPQVTLGRSGTARVTIRSISFIGPKLAQVRWTREVRRAEGAATVETSHWVSTLGFDWSRGAIGNQDRLENPLGFLVTDYRVDPEAP
jgi:type IV secretion system protein VirB8